MTPFEGPVFPRTRRWWLSPLPVVPVAMMAWFLARGVKSTSVVGISYITMMLMAMTLAMARAFASYTKTSQSKTLRIDENGVSIDGRLELPRKQMLGGAHLRPRKTGELTVRIPATVPLRSLEVDVMSQADGLAVLQALGQDPAHATVRFRLESGFENPTLRKMATFCLASIWGMNWVGNVQGTIVGTFAALWMAAFAVSALSFLLPTHVTVGADGVFVEKGGRRRFVPFSQVEDIRSHPSYSDAIVLALIGGESITLRTSVQDRENNAQMASDDTRALRTRLESAWKSFRETTTQANALLQLKRGGRSAKEWMSSLEGLRKERGYREVSVSDEALWRVLEDPSASSEDRAAALVALRGSLDEQGKERQRVALEACAEPRLRVLAEAIVNEDEAELENALDEIRETA